MKQGISIAIDGPAGSGKSTIAKMVATHFNYIYIDTGAMYRAITLKALRQGISVTENETNLTRLAEATSVVLEYEHLDMMQPRLKVILDGLDVSEAIRSLEVTNQVSHVAAVAGVRAALVRMQQQMASDGGVVMDGRDIGTVVLPGAELKVFLTASVEERSKRRWLELQEKGVAVDIKELEDQIQRRDFIDSNREVDPLRQADDAILLDTTALNIDQVAAELIRLAKQRGAV